MTILVTGIAGYIGSVLGRLLLKKDYRVMGFDNLSFGDHGLKRLSLNKNFKFYKGDIRESKSYHELLKKADAVIHLAAIVGDPACSKYPALAKNVNWNASKKFYDYAASEPNIKNFIFSSTCSNYGKTKGGKLVDEGSPLNPVSLYAELKVALEKHILDSRTRSDFIPTPLRFATVYGLSPRMRFDLTVNEFAREVALGKELIIYGEQFWRPYCHVEDLARGCISVLEANPKVVDHQVFNVGDTKENYRKKDLVDIILNLYPSAKIKFVYKDEDPRDYRVNFDKIKKALGYKISKTVPQGIKEICKAVESGRFINTYSSKYSNV